MASSSGLCPDLDREGAPFFPAFSFGQVRGGRRRILTQPQKKRPVPGNGARMFAGGEESLVGVFVLEVLTRHRMPEEMVGPDLVDEHNGHHD